MALGVQFFSQLPVKGYYISPGGSGCQHFSYFPTTGYLGKGGFVEVKFQSGAADKLRAPFFHPA